MEFHHDPSLLITAPFTAPPASVVLGALESNTSAPFFAEQQNVTLSGAATINASAAGTYDSPGDLIAGSLAAGTYLSSWYLHFDKIGGGNTTVFLAGSITFDSDILGVVLLDPDLLDTDVLGAPVTTYPAAGRQFDLDLGDVFSISADHRTLAFRAGTSSGADVLRIFVAGSSGVPEPRALALALLALGAFGVIRRRAGGQAARVAGLQRTRTAWPENSAVAVGQRPWIRVPLVDTNVARLDAARAAGTQRAVAVDACCLRRRSVTARARGSCGSWGRARA